MGGILGRSLWEICFLFFIIAALVFGSFSPAYRMMLKIGILAILYLWASLAWFGILIPVAEHRFTIGFFNNPEKNELGYPISVSLKSKGGFICHNPITVEAKIKNITSPNGKIYEAQKLFKENFQELNLAWFDSQLYPSNKTGFIKGEPETGGVTIDLKTYSGKSRIIFTSPGKYGPKILYIKKGEHLLASTIKDSDIPAAFLQISPPEVLYQLRFSNVTYFFSLIVLSFSMRALLNDFKW